MSDWPGLRTSLTPQRAEELLVQHSRTNRRRVGWCWIRVCHDCGQQVPCSQERWARAELRRPADPLPVAPLLGVLLAVFVLFGAFVVGLAWLLEWIR